MPEETGKSKVASWLTSQGLKKVRTEVLFNKTELFVHTWKKILLPDCLAQ